MELGQAVFILSELFYAEEKKCFDLVEIFTVYILHNSKKILLQVLFLFRTVKKLLHIIRLFIKDIRCKKFIVKNNFQAQATDLRCSLHLNFF